MKLTKAQFIYKWNLRFADNDVFRIKEADLAELTVDVGESFGDFVANDSYTLYKSVRYYSSTHPNYTPNDTAVDMLNDEYLCLGCRCYVDLPQSGEPKYCELRYDNTSSLQVWRDGSFYQSGVRLGASWFPIAAEEGGSADPLPLALAVPYRRPDVHTAIWMLDPRLSLDDDEYEICYVMPSDPPTGNRVFGAPFGPQFA